MGNTDSVTLQLRDVTSVVQNSKNAPYVSRHLVAARILRKGNILTESKVYFMDDRYTPPKYMLSTMAYIDDADFDMPKSLMTIDETTPLPVIQQIVYDCLSTFQERIASRETTRANTWHIPISGDLEVLRDIDVNEKITGHYDLRFWGKFLHIFFLQGSDPRFHDDLEVRSGRSWKVERWSNNTSEEQRKNAADMVDEVVYQIERKQLEMMGVVCQAETERERKEKRRAAERDREEQRNEAQRMLVQLKAMRLPSG
jgi:hypothetical protein